jgi:hypothetical protein
VFGCLWECERQGTLDNMPEAEQRGPALCSSQVVRRWLGRSWLSVAETHKLIGRAPRCLVHFVGLSCPGHSLAHSPAAGAPMLGSLRVPKSTDCRGVRTLGSWMTTAHSVADHSSSPSQLCCQLIGEIWKEGKGTCL